MANTRYQGKSETRGYKACIRLGLGQLASQPGAPRKGGPADSPLEGAPIFLGAPLLTVVILPPFQKTPRGPAVLPPWRELSPPASANHRDESQVDGAPMDCCMISGMLRHHVRWESNARSAFLTLLMMTNSTEAGFCVGVSSRCSVTVGTEIGQWLTRESKYSSCLRK